MTMQLPDQSLPWPIAWPAVEEIARSESCRLQAYLCPAGVWTIGWGHTKGVKRGDRITQEQADRLLCDDLTEWVAEISPAITREASDNQLGAMVSLAYNVGVAGFLGSTALKRHNAGDEQGAARAFGLWNKSKGKVLAGLTARRARESALYLTPDYDVADAMPQAIDPESTLARSPIAQSGAVSIAGGVVAAMSSMAAPVKEMAESVGVDPLMVLGAIAIIVGAIVLDQRRKQRREGWA